MHANKLKRKLADLGIEGNNPKLTESFCLIGTPLPPLEKTKDTGEFVPLWKQDVRDEKGRRRLHGAFTGGFSAGYFNTVGSAEGWTPATFKSSRADRAKQNAARPEDFMDEEDLAEMRDDQKLVDLNDEMDVSGPSGRNKDEDECDVFLLLSLVNALASLVPPSKDSIGAQILKKMGWKVGQGIGPKLTYHQRKLQDAQERSRSGYLASTSVEDDEDDEEANKHMYPPRDTKQVIYTRKDNSFGIGYTAGARLDSFDTNQKEMTGPKISTGFGLGALNDAEEDDIDVYDTSNFSSNTHRRNLAFEEQENDDDSTMSLHKSQLHGTTSAFKQPRQAEPLPKSSILFRSGAPVLPGFVLATSQPSEQQWFHPPKVPDGWEPDPRRVWNKDSSAATQSPPVPVVAAKPQVHPSRAAFLKNALNADQRGAALGETPLPAAPKSVFDYLSPKDRERLQKLASTNLAIPSSSSSSSSAQQEIPPVTEDLTSIPRLDSFIAQQALKGFQPFQRDAEKAARYNAYLRSQLGELGNDDDSSVVLRPGPYQSKEEFYKELREFAKSATIFKPATGALGGRFASAKVIESLDIGKDGLFVPGPDSESASVNYLGDEVKQEKEAKKEDPIVEAARLGMFGPLTRTVKEWTPARLLCKRFGVKEPVREEAMDVDADKQDWRAQLPSQDQISQLTTLQQPNDKVMRAATSSFRGQGRDISNIGLGEDDEQGKEILTYTKPERDIFKAIFESDEEDEPEEVEEETKAPALSVPSTTGVDLPISKPTIEAVPSGSLIVDVYIPKDSAKQESLDLSSFRPTFKSKARDYKGDKKDKEKKKSSKKGKAILSFDADDAEGPAISPAKPKKQKKDKPKAKEVALVEDDDAMWVEKPAPAVAATFATSMTGSEGVLRPPEVQPSKPTGRMKASDFI